MQKMDVKVVPSQNTPDPECSKVCLKYKISKSISDQGSVKVVPSPSQNTPDPECPKVCLKYEISKSISHQGSLRDTEELESKYDPSIEILFQGPQNNCSDSKIFDPNNLSEFEHEKLVKLFKQKAAIAYLISVGCTTHRSLKDMTQYVLENDEPPPFKPQCVAQLLRSDTLGVIKRHSHKHRNRKEKAGPLKLRPNGEIIKRNDATALIKASPKEIRNDLIHVKVPKSDFKTAQFDHIRPSTFSLYPFGQNMVEPTKPLVLRNLREKEIKVPKVVKKEVMRTSVLLPPLHKEDRKSYKDKVSKYFHVDISPKNLQTVKQRIDYREKCRKKDAEWRKYIEKWGLYFPYSGFLYLRHKAIKELEDSHMSPGMYYPDEYDEIQRSKKLQMQRGFDNGVPRFFEKDEFGHLTPFSYGDGAFKYDSYMRKSGNIRNTSFAQAERFSNQNKDCGPSIATYDFPTSVDTLLKSRKGVFYPKGGIPRHKRHPRAYNPCGYNATPKEDRPRSINESDFLRDIQIHEENSIWKPLPGMASELKNRNNQHKGKFRKSSSKVFEAPLESTPGPGSYDYDKKPAVRITKEEKKRLKERTNELIQSSITKKDLSNVDYMPTKDFYYLADTYNSEPIGPGSYNIAGSLDKLNGFPGRFKKGLPQRPSLTKLKALEERLRGKDIPLEEKFAKVDL